MTAFILKRLGLALITLWILSVIIFFAAQVLPGDPARSILGPLAAPSAVHALDHQLGTDKPLIQQYTTWIGHMVSGSFGTSYEYQAPIGPILGTALVNSLKLAVLAFILVVPLGIIGGVIGALNHGKRVDRAISVFGLSASTVSDVVWSILLVVIFGIWLNVLPIQASTPPGSSIGTQVYHLILPALPLVFILFAYIQQMARAGTVEALNSDYARTATLKGLPRGVMIRRHVLRNSLLPTITVIATQVGYLIGGLVVVETIFHYNGIGTLLYNAATKKDIPMLEAGVLVIGVIYMVATLVADILYSVLNPRIRYRGVE